MHWLKASVQRKVLCHFPHRLANLPQALQSDKSPIELGNELLENEIWSQSSKFYLYFPHILSNSSLTHYITKVTTYQNQNISTFDLFHS